MKRCPACGTVYSVAQGFCPMDGAPLADDAPTGASASASMSGNAALPGQGAHGLHSVLGAWDPPRASVSSSEMFVMPSQPRAVSASTGPGASTGNFVIPPLGSPGMTSNGFLMPLPTRPANAAAAAVAVAKPDPDPADTSTAFIPPVITGSKRTVVAMVPPGARSPGERLASVDAPRAGVRSDMFSGSGGTAGASGASGSAPSVSSGAGGLFQVPASAVVPDGGPDSGAFFPPGGLSRVRPEAPAPSTWEESLIGRVLDQRYRIEGCIGAGGMGVVYKATHVIIDKPLAIKMLRADVASQPDVVKRFLVEAQLASKVKHPNVVDISDYGQIAGQTAYYVMEYLSGETLAQRVDTRGRLDPALAVDIALQTAHALQAAHACKIIHRDLKSENIFLCDRPGGGVQVKILDFGIARIRDKKTRLTAMGALIGTPAYMSPEQAQGSEVDERSDLYALGVILFEMLAGRVPFKAATVALVLSAQIFEAPPSLQQIDPGVPDLPNLEHVLHRLLAKNRDERPDDADEVIHLIKTAAEIDLGGHIGPGTTSTSLKHRRATVTIGSWSVAENPSGMRFSDDSPSVAGEARATPRPETDALVARPFTSSGRIQRRPSVIVPAGTHVERIAAPPVRPPITGELEARHSPTGVNPRIPQAGPPMILIIAAAASIGAAITVTLYKLWRRNQVPVMTAPEYAAPLPAAVHRLGFESEPSGATVVTEDGDRWGITPFTRTLPPGSARTRVIFKLDGHDDASLDVQAGASAMHKVLLRPRIPVLAPVPADVTTAGPLGDATAGAGETPVEAPGKGVTAVKTRPSKTRPPSSSKDPVPETAPEPIAPAADAKAEEELDMGELKNPFRNKK